MRPEPSGDTAIDMAYRQSRNSRLLGVLRNAPSNDRSCCGDERPHAAVNKGPRSGQCGMQVPVLQISNLLHNLRRLILDGCWKKKGSVERLLGFKRGDVTLVTFGPKLS